MNKNTIDVIYFSDDECIMIITFPYEWVREEMEYIQDKVNLYLHYVESNQLYDNYPDCKGNSTRIRLVYDIVLTEEAETFLNDLGSALNNIKISFDYFSTDEIDLINN